MMHGAANIKASSTVHTHKTINSLGFFISY